MIEPVKILLAEDSAKYERNLLKCLPSGLFEVATVDNFLQLINLYQTLSPDFLVAKSKLQYASSSSVIKNIRQKFGDKDIKIYINAYEEDSNLRENLEHFGINQYFEKPDAMVAASMIMQQIITTRPFKGPYKLLIVDNDTRLWEILSKVLNRRCYKLMFADNGQCGLEAYKDFSPDILFMNVRLPEIQGPDLLQIIRHKLEDQDTTVIATATERRHQLAFHVFQLGNPGIHAKAL